MIYIAAKRFEATFVCNLDLTIGNILIIFRFIQCKIVAYYNSLLTDENIIIILWLVELTRIFFPDFTVTELHVDQ